MLAMLGVTLLALALVLRAPSKLPPAKNTAGGRNAPSASLSPTKPSQPATPDGQRPTVPSVFNPLETEGREVDLALLDTLSDLGLGPDIIHFEDVRRLEANGQPYHFQAITLAMGDKERRAMPAAFTERLAQRLPRAALVDNAGVLEVRLGGVLTHQLKSTDMTPGNLGAAHLASAPRKRAPGAPARLVIVIDDLGENLTAVRELIGLGIPIVFSIWPKATHTQQTLELAQQAGVQAIMHQPMQAMDSTKYRLGKGALYVRMSEAAIRAQLTENLDEMPGVIGFNNHMGSTFTTNSAGMRTVLRVAEDRRLFFLDSMTTPYSVAENEAQKLGITILRRDVFLDHVASVAAITGQLRKAETVAMRTGSAIAIGHPRPQTITALRAWIAQRDKQVELHGITALLPQGHPSLARHAEGRSGS